MNKNMSNIDKYARSIIGLGIIGLGIYYQNWLGLIGLVPIAISLYGSCPIYSLINFSTLKKAKTESKASAKVAKKKSVKKTVKKKKK